MVDMNENQVLEVVEEKDSEVIKRICDRTALDLRSRGMITKNNSVYATVAQLFIEGTIAKLLEMKKEHAGEDDYDVSINLFDFIKVGIERETYEEDENDGNIVPFIEPGTAFMELVRNNERPEDVISIVEEEDVIE
jgi:hypothetical protein